MFILARLTVSTVMRVIDSSPVGIPSVSQIHIFVLRDDFRQNPQDQVVVVGDPANLDCQPPRGHPEPTVYWKKDKARLDLKDDRITVRGGKLTISGARKSDAGMYVCVAANMVGEKESETAQLSVFERPVFVQRPVNQVVLVEESVEFRCQVQGDPPPTVRWKKEDLDVSRGRYDIRSEKEDSLLRIKRALASDQGTFTCIAENRVEAPQFVVRPRDQIVTQGRTATFPCETKGKPQPTVFWQREGSQGDSRVSVSLSGEMTIRSVQRSDAGYYTCQALTVAGSILAKAQLEVADASKDRPPPIIRRGPANQTQAVGGASVLRCQASGDPEPSITWLKNRASLLGKDPRMFLLDHGSLQILDTQLSDAGLFTCVATSSTGETSWSAFLDVRESSDLVDFMSHNASALPGPPSKPEVTDVTKSSISLSWEPGPEAGTSPVTSYVIEAFGQSVSNSWTTLADHVRSSRFTVRDLRPNTKELGEVLVSLHNPVVLSSTSVHITWTVENPSQFIQGYHVLFRQTSGLPSPGSWAVEDMKVSSERDLTLPALRKGIVYEIKVRPYFNEFQGADSESMTARTLEEGAHTAGGSAGDLLPRLGEVAGGDTLAGGEPVGLSSLDPPLAGCHEQVTLQPVGNSNSTSVTVAWDTPPPDQQNGIIQEYKIWCATNESQFSVNRTVDASVRSVVLGGLQAGVPYYVEVAASTSVGVGGGGSSLSEVVKQPAFIAGLGGAVWIVLMGFSAWLYWRRKKRKGISNYAVTFQRDQGLIRNGR
ncbi:hypothetical protein NHX12_009552 [Muraenolepis orangiensis]|uniref:Roundabout n=1 Tax=Muraenolepis orangiensis TaxID=630683 RepID=A0A9Q0DHU3_9TELE|nr:hypothetical protein NHX12_009552 [Muraenolepis orangiensis]